MFDSSLMLWVNLPILDTICPQISKSVIDVKIKATSDFKLYHKSPRSDFPGQVNFALRHTKIEVWLSNQQVKLALVVLLVIISNQPHNFKRKHAVDKV